MCKMQASPALADSHVGKVMSEIAEGHLTRMRYEISRIMPEFHQVFGQQWGKALPEGRHVRHKVVLS